MSWPWSIAWHSCLPMAITLSPSRRTVSGRSGDATPSRMTANSEQPSGMSRSRGARPMAGEPGLEVRLDELELALAEGGQVEQLVDRDVLLDRAEDHPGRADQLVDAEVPEERLVLGVVDAGDRARHVEVVLGHLADDEVVLVVTGHRGHDVRPVAAGLAEVLALAAVVGDDDRADLVGDLPARAAGPSP